MKKARTKLYLRLFAGNQILQLENLVVDAVPVSSLDCIVRTFLHDWLTVRARRTAIGSIIGCSKNRRTDIDQTIRRLNSHHTVVPKIIWQDQDSEGRGIYHSDRGSHRSLGPWLGNDRDRLCRLYMLWFWLAQMPRFLNQLRWNSRQQCFSNIGWTKRSLYNYWLHIRDRSDCWDNRNGYFFLNQWWTLIRVNRGL